LAREGVAKVETIGFEREYKWDAEKVTGLTGKLV